MHVYAVGELKRRDGASQPIVPAGMSQHSADSLRDLAIEQNAVRTIETGLGMGLSALALGQAILNSGNPDALHTSIDPYTDRMGHAGLDMVRASALGPYFRFIAQPSQLALPQLVSASERFDLALIDGAHFFETALIDIYYAMMLVREGGLIVVDDVWMPAVRTAVNYATTNLNCEQLPSPHARFSVLVRPTTFPPQRPWDAFTAFAVAE